MKRVAVGDGGWRGKVGNDGDSVVCKVADDGDTGRVGDRGRVGGADLEGDGGRDVGEEDEERDGWGGSRITYVARTFSKLRNMTGTEYPASYRAAQ